jgi:predicted O-methyltransferase YrrM
VAEYPNWFGAYAEKFFTRHLMPLAGRPRLRFLQIGAFTGDASLWLCENVLTGRGSVLVDVDTWQGSNEVAHHAMDFSDVEHVYDRRTVAFREAGVIDKRKATSAEFLRSCDDRFDFIYIDGDHTAAAVLADAVGALPLLKPEGLIAFDDYLWTSTFGGELATPKPAIDAFAAVHADRLQLVQLGPQAWYRLNGPVRPAERAIAPRAGMETR